jgi:hypothetical protein
MRYTLIESRRGIAEVVELPHPCFTVVIFDNTGKVVGTGVTLDPKEAGQLGK